MRTLEEQYELLENLLAVAKRGGENGELDWLEFKTNIAEHACLVKVPDTHDISYKSLGHFLLTGSSRN